MTSLTGDKSKYFKLISGLNPDLKLDLVKVYEIAPLDVEDVFTSNQLSKIEQKPNYLYVALQFPEYEKTRRSFVIKELHCFISSEYFLVIDKHNFKYLQKFDNIKFNLNINLNTPFSVFYEMLDFIITQLFRVIGKFRQEIEVVEKEVFADNQKSDFLLEVLIIKRNLINFLSIVSPLEKVLIDLQEKYNNFVDEDGRERLDDSLDKIIKILNNLSNFQEQITLLHLTNEAQTTRSTNQIIKTLTVVNIIVLIPTIVASIFGMNVHFGWNTEETNFTPLFLILVSMIFFTFSVILFFKKKGWV